MTGIAHGVLPREADILSEDSQGMRVHADTSELECGGPWVRSNVKNYRTSGNSYINFLGHRRLWG